MLTTVKNNNQILSLIRIGRKKSLINIINKVTRIDVNTLEKLLEKATINNETDKFIYNKLNKMIKNFQQYNISERAEYTAKYIKSLLNDINYKTDALLDVGCGDCSVTKEVNKILDIKDTPNCVDVENWLDTYSDKEEGCNVKYITNNEINFEDQSMDIILALHSLHHIDNLDKMLKEISRVIKNDGIFVIKEHNCLADEDKLLIDVYHALYECVMKQEPNKNFIDTYFAKYFSAKELDDKLNVLGFRLLKTKFTKSDLKNYFSIYKKIDLNKKYEKYKKKYYEIKEGTMNSPNEKIYETENIFIKKRSFGENIDVSKFHITNVSEYSISSVEEANQTANKIAELMETNDLIITDATANVGGNTAGFAKKFKFVNAIEIVKIHADMLKENLKSLGFENKVKVYNDDYTKIYNTINQDVIFLDPEWGGPDYKKKYILDIKIGGIDLVEFLKMILDKAKLIVLKLPFNYNFNKLLKELKSKNIIFEKFMKIHKTPHFLVYIMNK